MAKGNFEKAYARVRVYEGGNVDDPHDPGGRTSRGVTQRVYNSWCVRNGVPQGDVWKASEGQIARIYKELYWDRCACDALPAGIDFVVYDAAVNSGVGQAARWAQRAIGMEMKNNSGGFGYLTVQALNEAPDNDAVCAEICSRRLGTLKTLKTWPRYGKGWSARIANVLKIGQAWATGAQAPLPVNVVSLFGNEKASVEDVAKPPISTTSTNVVTAATAVASGASDAAQSLQAFSGSIAWLTYVLAGLTIVAALASLYVRIKHSQAEKAEKGEQTTEVDIYADDAGQPVLVNDNEPVVLDSVPNDAKAA